MKRKIITAILLPLEFLGKLYFKSEIFKSIFIYLILIVLVVWGFIIHKSYGIDPFILFIIGAVIFSTIIFKLLKFEGPDIIMPGFFGQKKVFNYNIFIYLFPVIYIKNMKYSEILAHIKEDNICPFCQEKHPHMIHENEHMFIIPARAPYVADHLLIVPKRHVILLQELNHPELIALHELVDIRTKRLHTKHEAVNLLLRDGLADKKSQKSINHLHFHLIPDCPIGAREIGGENREFLDDQTYVSVTKILKETYN